MVPSQRTLWMLGASLFLGLALVLAVSWSTTREVYQDQGPAVTGPLDGPYIDTASAPSVLQLANGTYMMWYESVNHYSSREAIRVALSLDGIQWFPAGVALTGSGSPWDLMDVGMPTALLASTGYAGSDVDLWFTGLANGSNQLKVYHARGDGSGFTIDGIAFAPQNGTWYADGIWGPSVVRTQTGYRLYFASTLGIGVAESRGTLGFTAIGSSPVLTPGPQGAWDSHGVSMPYVTDAFGGWTMYYMGNSGIGGSVGIANSTDGLTWSKSPDNPVLTPAGSADSWNGYCICGGSVAVVSHRPVLYYSGFGNQGQGAIGRAPLVTVSVPLWSVPPLLSGFLLATALSTAVLVWVWRPWARERRVEETVWEQDERRAP